MKTERWVTGAARPGGERCGGGVGTGGLAFGGDVYTGGACFGTVCVAATCVPGFGGADLATLVCGGLLCAGGGAGRAGELDRDFGGAFTGGAFEEEAPDEDAAFKGKTSVEVARALEASLAAFNSAS